MYQPGDTVLITDIGVGVKGSPDTGSSLVCITTNVNTNCCRPGDGGNVGEWFFPNGTIVPRNSDSPNGDFTRIGWTHEVRLNRRNNAITPLGNYTCVVPYMNNTMDHTATVTLSLGKSIADNSSFPFLYLLQHICLKDLMVEFKGTYSYLYFDSQDVH